MARNNPKPIEKTNWIPDDTTNIVTPSAGRKLVGWLFNIKPPAEIFNWFWNLKSRFEDYFSAQVEDWIVIDSDADEGDYATLAAYIADSPAAGDRILVKEDQTVTAQAVLPADVTLKFLDGSRLLCATNIATSVLKLGSNLIIEGVLNIVLSHTGTTAKAVEIDGDNAVGKINIENSSTGTLTTGYHINANKTGNRIEGFVQNTGGGTLTNYIIDNSTEDSNIIMAIDEPNNTIKTNGTAFVDLFNTQTIEGIKTFSDEIIGNGGIQTDGVNILKTKVINIGDWDMVTDSFVSVGSGIARANIRGISVIIIDDDAPGVGVALDINWTDGSGTGNQGISISSSGIIGLYRQNGGAFDNTDYNSTSYNRGWVTVTYTV